MIKKILIVTTRFPFPLFSGDKLRIYNISKNLSKKNKVDLIYTGSEKSFKRKIKFINKIIFIKTNKIKKILQVFYFLLIGKPLQIGYFFSNEMKKKIKEIQNNYDCIIFHLVRSGEFLSKDYKGIKILEMTDVVSKNYIQLYERLNVFNPIKYLYLLELKLLEMYEKKIIKLFNYVVLVSKSDLKKISYKNKVKIITNGTNLKEKKFKFNPKNNDVVFIGNINYLPNKIACYEFINKIMPKLKEVGLNINFKIIGKTSKLLKLSLSSFKNVNVYNNVKFPENLCKNAICGISNLSIATGVQNKILEYMRIGLPAIISEKCFYSLNLKKNKHILVYKNHSQLIKQIIKLKKSKKIANKISFNSFAIIKKNYTWETSLKKYNNLI